MEHAVDFENEPDRPMRDDIRLLGRLLGDTVRDQEGNAAFELVEHVRQSAIAFHRDENVDARRELERTLDGLSREQTMIVARAFSYFSHLANLAEDLHNSRRKRQSDIKGEPPADGSLAGALDRVAAAGVSLAALAAFFRDGVVVPVLTAHPTEVQRKSVRDLEMQLEQLLQARERTRLTPQELAANDESIRRAVLSLWQTRMLRLEKLEVLDEVANGLSFFEQTFLPEVPLLYGALEDELQRRYPAAAAVDLPSFLRIGSWIGGDRDGNPFVTADVLARTLRMQSSRVFEYYLEQLHTLGAELSMTTLVTAVSPELTALADRSPDKSPHRRDEPYRRALTGLYARIAATARDLDLHEPLRHAVGDAPPYQDVAEFAADLEIIHRSLAANASALLARGRLRHLRRAVDVFGFHLAAVDMRQNSDVHQRVVAELFRAARPDVDYAVAGRSRPRAGAGRRAGDAAPAQLAVPRLLRRNPQRARDPADRRADAPALRRRVHPQLRDLEVRRRVRRARGGAAAARGRPLPRDGRAPRLQRDPAVRDDRRPAQRGWRDGCVAVAAGVRAHARLARQGAGSDARVLRQQQGRRLPDLALGTVQGTDRTRRDVRQARHPHAAVPWPRRLGRPRRRPDVRGHPRATRRHRAGTDPRHGTGRGHRRQVLECRGRTPQPGSAGRGDARGHAARRRRPRAANRNTSRRWRNFPASAFAAYRHLVYETPGFEDYFWESTVISEIAELNIGSRPASRNQSRSIETLRAIPWVFSWAQCRLMLPGWYGFGSAVDAWLDEHGDEGLRLLQEMHREWPFFASVLSNMEMVLSKADIAIASRYADLVTDPALRATIFSRIRAELESTLSALLRIMGTDELLAGNPQLARSIKYRFPYLDPLNHIQIELLRRFRAGDKDERSRRGIHLTINGVAAGLRNSG